MIILDDHLALHALAGVIAPSAEGPLATTWCFQYRAARALADTSRGGRLSPPHDSAAANLSRMLSPPADRLVVLDPRASAAEAVRVAVEYGANLLLAELVGAAKHYSASIRVSEPNVGRSWERVMTAEGVTLEIVESGGTRRRR